MPYKRSSRIARHFLSPIFWPFGTKSEFFNTHAWFQQLGAFAEQENVSYLAVIAVDGDFRMDRTCTDGSKPDSNSARAIRRKNRVGAVFGTYQEAPHSIDFGDMDFFVCAIRNGDLERITDSVRRNAPEIEEGRGDVHALGRSLDLDSDRNEDLLLLMPESVTNDDVGLASPYSGNNAVISN